MAGRPIIFLAFANSNTDPLPQLTKEDNTVYKILQKRFMEENHYILHRDSHATVETIWEQLNEQENVLIFHYAGHAESDKLLLASGEAKSEGIAKMLAQQKNLQLVFLNGCSTRNQAKRLLELGIPAVIATSVPVNDNTAQLFAKAFYTNMEKGKSLKDAFESASAVAETFDKEVKMVRSLSWEEDEEMDDSTEFPWALYANTDEDDEGEEDGPLAWKIPDIDASEDEKPYIPNEYIDEVIDEMLASDPSLKSEVLNRDGEKKEPKELRQVIIQTFPWPIGAQIRILISDQGNMDKAGLSRLRQMIQIYQNGSRLLCYIMLSQFWDEIRNKAALKKSIPEPVMKLFALRSKKSSTDFDYIDLANQVYEVLNKNKASLFAEEVAPIFKEYQEKGEMEKIRAFCEATKRDLNKDEITEPKAGRMCRECELLLTAFLKKIAFLVRYRLVTIKQIDVSKFRDEKALFQHHLGRLHHADKDYIAYGNKPKVLEHSTDSKSILLVKGESYQEQMNESLNLSPFLIDRHAFERKPEPKIYLFDHTPKSDYSYISVDLNLNDPDTSESHIWLQISRDDNSSSDNPFVDVHQQFDVLFQDFDYKAS